jgi:hypothetical protein
MENKPYTYLIGWSQHNLWYYGVRYASICHPNDLWQTYFTSSKYVKESRKLYGEPDIVTVRRVFNDKVTAIQWENKVLRRMNVLRSDNWLNRNINGYMTSKPGKMNSMYGKKHTPETILKIQNAAKGKRHGKYNNMYGKTHTLEVKELLRDKAIGANNPQFTGYFITPWGKFESAPLAANSCPSKIRSWTLIRWCKDGNHKTVTRGGIQKSEFLSDDMFGKTFSELGFGFERIENGK